MSNSDEKISISILHNMIETQTSVHKAIDDVITGVLLRLAHESEYEIPFLPPIFMLLLRATSPTQNFQPMHRIHDNEEDEMMVWKKTKSKVAR